MEIGILYRNEDLKENYILCFKEDVIKGGLKEVVLRNCVTNAIYGGVIEVHHNTKVLLPIEEKIVTNNANFRVCK